MSDFQSNLLQRRAAEKKEEGIPSFQRDTTIPGLFSVDATLPNEWSQSVAGQMQLLNSVKNGEMGAPVQVDSRGIPVGWDYKTAKEGPWGEPLPSRAVGWLPTAEPDFGPGLAGWWQRTLNNIYEERGDEAETPKVTEVLQSLFDRIGQAHAQRDIAIQEGAEIGEKKRVKANLGVLGTAAAGTIGAALEIIKNSWHTLEGEEVTPLTAIPRIIGETFRTAGDLLQKPAEWAESEIIGPRILANIELAQKYDLVTQEDMENWDGWVGQFGIFPVWGRVATAVMTGKIPREEFYSMDNEYRNQTAAKIAYTAWKDTAVKEEFLRRVRAGEDPRLLALELEDPVDEMVLEFIFDPLNIIDVWYTAGKVATRGTRVWARLNRGRLAMDMEDKFKALRAAIDLGDEMQIGRVMTELGPMIDKGRDSLLAGEVASATKRGLVAKLQTFNQIDRAEDFGNHYADILRAVNLEPSRAVNVYLATIEAISKNPEEKLSGLKKLTDMVQQSGGKLDMDLIFSDEGIRSAILFKDMVSDAAGNIVTSKMDDLFEKAAMVMDDAGPLLDAKGLPIAAKGHKLKKGEQTYVSYEKLTELMSADMEKILKRRFPVIQDAVKQNKKYTEIIAKHGEDSAQAINYLRKNPAAATEPSKALQRLIPFHDKAQKYFYSPSASVQSKIFMGMNPAYMYRNRIGNSVAILVDQGPRAAFRGMAPRFMGGKNKAIATVQDWTKTGELIPRGLKRSQVGAHSAFTLTEKAREWGPILKTAAEDERLARVHVAAKIIPQVIRDVFHPRRALQGIDTVFDSEDDVKLFVKLGRMQGKGDVDETMRLFNEIRGTEVARTLDGITPYDMHFIEEMGLDEDLLTILRNKELSQSDIVRHLEELKEDIAEYGLLAAREPALMDIDDALGIKAEEIMDSFISTFGEELGNIKGDEFIRRVNANFQWTESAKLELRQAVRKLRQQIRQDLVGEAAAVGQSRKARKSAVDALNAIDEVEIRVLGSIEEIQHKTRKAHHAFLYDVRRLSDEANELSLDFLVDIWNGGGARRLRFPLAPDTVITLGPEIIVSAGEVGVTPQLFKEHLWDAYRNLTEGAYNQSAILEVDAYRDAINGLEMYHTGEIAEELSGMAAETDKLGAIAKMMQRAVVNPDTGEAAVHATKVDLDAVLQHRVESIMAKSDTAIEGETITQKLADAKAALSENPNLKIDDVIDKNTKDALVQTAGPRWRKLAEFMMGEEVPINQRAGQWLADNIGDELTELMQEPLGRFIAEEITEEKMLEEIAERLSAEHQEAFRLAVEEPTHSIPIVAGADGGTPSTPRFFNNVSPTANQVLNRVIDVVRNEFTGGVEARVLDKATQARFNEWAPQARKYMERARTEATRKAVAAGDFAMHHYGDRMGMDLLLGYIFPYQFWYSRSYAKWMQRAVRHPGLTGAYFRYKDVLAKEHAGLPDWWKYQLNTNELLGLDSKNPIWFNIEALANPIHGLTGVDFTDPKRRIDGWGAWMEDMNKFGPTVWAPYQLATVLKYSLQGEDEAASRWAGRILPFSKPIRDLTALADPKGLGIEIDPYVHLFGGGIEAYERNRVGRQLGLMMDDPQFNKADVIDATYNKEGEIWDTARARTIQERSPNVAFALAPFFFGAGAKPRNVEDQVIDRMYGQMDGLIKNRDNMSADQYRAEWQQLRQQYPFMDVILMSKKAGLERDEALAWNVLGRIPPGMTRAIAEQAGVSRNVLDTFYENKGDMTLMKEADRLRFMGSVLEIGGLLDIPEAATQAEWQVARNLYKEMKNAGTAQYGDDIWDMVDLYYASKADDDPEVGREFLRVNPIVSDALDWQQVMIQNTPLLASYYTSDERIRQFYKTQMYQIAEELFGEDLWDQFEIYSRLKDLGEDKAAREFWKDNPGLSGYMELKETTLPKIEEKVDHFGTIIPEKKPAKYRHEEYDITPQAPVSDDREAAILAQVLAYSEAFTNYSGQRTDIKGIIREQADEIWPNTRRDANNYYQMLTAGKADKAADYLKERGELQARVMWEFDKIQRLDLTTLGQMFQAAGAAQGLEEPFAEPPGIDPNTPLGRLFNDPQGIPEHLWRAYLTYGQ